MHRMDPVSYATLSKAVDYACAVDEKTGAVGAKAAFMEMMGRWMLQSMIQPLVPAIMVHELEEAIERLRELQLRIAESSLAAGDRANSNFDTTSL